MLLGEARSRVDHLALALLKPEIAEQMHQVTAIGLIESVGGAWRARREQILALRPLSRKSP